MVTFEYGTSTIEYSVIKSNRQTVTISVEPSNNVVIKAPLHFSDEKIMQIAKAKAKWITGKLFEMQGIESREYITQYVNGESFPYLGRNYSLQLIDDNSIISPVVKYYRGKLNVNTPSRDEDIIKKAIMKWYQEKAKEKIPQRVAYYEKFFTEKCNRIMVKEQQKRWGSCTKDGTLIFNWKSIMAPANILDYIIVHEMCHLRFMNHSIEFWEMLRRVLPDYEVRKEWLMNNGIKLEL